MMIGFTTHLGGRAAPLILTACVALFISCDRPSEISASSAASPAVSVEDGAWETLETSGSPTARHENAFVEAGGKFYLIGGRGDRPVDVYDPQTTEWTQATGAPMEVHHFQAAAVDGKIYVVGAWTGGFPDEEGIRNVLIYDPATDSWSEGPAIPEERRRGAAGVVAHEDMIYVVAGNRGGHGPHAEAVDWFDRFDPATGEWSRLSPVPHPRDHFHAAVVGDRLYAVGGRDSGVDGFIDSTVAAVDVYDFESESWSTLSDSPLPTERAGSSTVALGDYIVITGGEGFGQTWGETEALDTETGEWNLIGRLQQPRHGTQAVVHDGSIYVAAGAGDQGGGPELTSMEVFR